MSDGERKNSAAAGGQPRRIVKLVEGVLAQVLLPTFAELRSAIAARHRRRLDEIRQEEDDDDDEDNDHRN